MTKNATCITIKKKVVTFSLTLEHMWMYTSFVHIIIFHKTLKYI